jgi:hypothetical protein
MAKFFPDSETKIPYSYRLAVSDEEAFPGGSPRSQEVMHGEYMCVCDVRNIDVVLQIGARAEDERCFAIGNAAVNRRNRDGVARTKNGC